MLLEPQHHMQNSGRFQAPVDIPPDKFILLEPQHHMQNSGRFQAPVDIPPDKFMLLEPQHHMKSSRRFQAPVDIPPDRTDGRVCPRVRFGVTNCENKNPNAITVTIQSLFVFFTMCPEWLWNSLRLLCNRVVSWAERKASPSNLNTRNSEA
jgi:hypothetical protein